jgi:hypothetical protein
MKKEWLRRKTTVGKAEQDHLVTDERLGPDPVAFGFHHERWRRFTSRMKEGDELWEFCSPPATWERLAGRKGLCIVRGGSELFKDLIKGESLASRLKRQPQFT